jgi:hypothetical protein
MSIEIIAPTALSSADIAVRLADEGIPVRAIARAIKVAGEEVYEVLRGAMLEGRLIGLPKDDWPPGSPRANRLQADHNLLTDEEQIKFLCSVQFKTTRLQSALLATILKRQQVSKQTLHDVIEHTRLTYGTHKEPTDQKMVDVMVCHLRKKLKPFNFDILTVWGTGYRMETAHREAALHMLAAVAAGGGTA